MRSALVAVLATAACAHPPPRSVPPSNHVEVAPARRVPGPAWVGCLYERAALGSQASQTVESWHDDVHAVLLLASIQRRGVQINSIIAQLPLDHVPAAGESFKIEGRLQAIERDPGDAPLPIEIRDPQLVLSDKEYDIVFADAPPLDGFTDFGVDAEIAVGDHGQFDVSLASTQEQDLLGVPAHISVAVLHLTTLAQCSLE